MLALTAISLALLLVATYFLSLHYYVWDAALLLVFSSLGLLVGLRRARSGGGRSWQAVRRLLPTTVPGWTRVGALVVAAWVAVVARARPPSAGYAGLFLLWLLTVVGFAASLLVPGLRGRRLRLTRSRTELYALLGLLVVAALLRGVGLGRIPANLGGDEGTQLLAGLRLVQRPMGNPFATGWYSVPTMSFFAYGLAMRVFGATIAGGRALSVLVGTATVLTTFLLGRALGGRRIGWGAALIVTFSSYHIHFSRLASNQIFDPLVGTLAVWLLWRALAAPSERVRWVTWGLAGLVAGLGWYVYFGARWVTFMIVLILGWRMWLTPDLLRRHRKGMAVFVVGWLVAALPLLGWYAAHPNALTERYNAVSIFASGWLAREVEIAGKPALRLLLEQLWKSATAFHLTYDPTFWFYPQMPLADFITGALMLVGVGVTLTRLHWPARGLTHLWFWSTLLMAWVLTENPPSSQRGLLLVPAVALFAAWGGAALWRRLRAERQLAAVAFIMLAGMLILLNVSFYFGIYTPRRTYGNPTARVATEFARFARQTPHPACAADGAPACPAHVYFFGPPTLYWEFGTLAFLLRDVPGQDIHGGTVPPEVTEPARFVFVPERAEELAAVRAVYPGGVERRVLASDGRLMVIVYDWAGVSDRALAFDKCAFASIMH
jgi:hypothetical protein